MRRNGIINLLYMFLGIKRKAIGFIAVVMFSSLTPPVANQKIYLAGGSTIADKTPNRFPETGWGEVIGHYFTSEVKIINCAANGSSTKTFINQKRWEKLINRLAKGDYVFIGFGHNDEKLDRPLVGSTLQEYEVNLIKFVREVKHKKAIPVLMTPLMRRSAKKGVFYNSHGSYPAVVRRVAVSENVALIDMLEKSRNLLQNTGVSESKKFFLHAQPGELVNYPNGIKDNTHLSNVGAFEMAKLVVEGIRELKLPLAAYSKSPNSN